MFGLALIVAVIAWTVTHEAVFKEWQDYTKGITNDPSRSLFVRKVAYPWTCEFCFSFWTTLLVLSVYGGGVREFFAIVALSNLMMAFWFIVRLFIRWLGEQSK